MQNSQKKTPRFVQDIIELAGSSTKLAARLDIHAFTVDGWKRSGIPTKYWDRIFEFYGVTPAELHAITQACRKAVTKPSKTK